MKKILFSLLCALLLLSFISCSSGGEGAVTDTGADTSSGTVKDSETTAAPYVPDRVVTEIYGMFDEQYDFLYEDINLISGTFTAAENTYDLLDELNSTYSLSAESRSKRPPALYYIIKRLGASKNDIMKYFAACYGAGITDIIPSDDIVNALSGDDEFAAMTACVHPGALAKDGSIFTLRMLLEGDTVGIDVTDTEIKATVDKALAYYGNGMLESSRISDTMKEKLIDLGYITEDKELGSLCTIHTDDFHTIPSELEALVDAAALKSWKEQPLPGGTDCAIGTNIISFVKEFEIPMDSFIDICNSTGGTLGNYPINIIYGDENAAYEYYSSRNAAAEADIAIDRALAELKAKIVEDKGMTDFITNVHEFSLAEILLMTDHDSAYLASLAGYTESIPGLDLESIYNDSANLMRMVGKRSVYFIDRLVTGRITFETPYDAQSTYDQ